MIKNEFFTGALLGCRIKLVCLHYTTDTFIHVIDLWDEKVRRSLLRHKTLEPSIEATTKTSDDEPTLTKWRSYHIYTDATKCKHGEISSVSSHNDSSMLDLNSEEVGLKIKSMVEKYVSVVTDTAIKEAELTVESDLEAIFSH